MQAELGDPRVASIVVDNDGSSGLFTGSTIVRGQKHRPTEGAERLPSRRE
jgi:hypothetical protein